MRALTVEQVAAARQTSASLAPEIVELAARIAAVPAPTGQEHDRAAVVAQHCREAGFKPVTVDEMGNVVATIAGRGTGPPLLLAAHLDTVFPPKTVIEVRRTEGRIAAPGIGDNSISIAALASLPRALTQLGILPAVELLITGNVGEEGLGNLRGMRAVMDANPDVGAAVAVEGHSLGHVTHQAVGSRRFRLKVAGPGGHSWGDAGRPSAIHALAGIVTELDRLPLGDRPKTSLNVGLIEGGISVNTIAPAASAVIDLRSVDPTVLDQLTERVRRIVTDARTDGISCSLDLLGERPAGLVPFDNRIVQTGVAALRAVGLDAVCQASSTDANLPISRGVPAICVGLTTGGNVHREDEFIHTEPVARGFAQLLLVILQVAEDLAAGKITRVGEG